VYAAEEIIDRQTIIELFRGQEFELTTGRVLLHALAADTRSLCDRDATSMSPTGRAWDASHLPHIPRCHTCVMASRTASPDGPVPGLPAADVDIRTAHDSDAEIAGIKALRDILAEHDLRRWMFTDLVTVNETIRQACPLAVVTLSRPSCT